MNRWQPLALVVALCTLQTAWADIPHPKAEPSAFDIALERAGAIAAKEDWKRDGFSDSKLENALADLVGRLRTITKNDALKLPVAFDSVRAVEGDGDSKVGFLRGELFAAKRAKVAHARNSIILADESAEVSSADDCLIIARGAVRISHCRRCFVIAGHFIEAGHDGHARPGIQGGNTGSVFLSGAVVRIAHATGTVVCAPVTAAISRASDATFINTPNRLKSIADDSGLLPRGEPYNPLLGKLTITQIVSVESSIERALVAAESEDGEVVIRIGKPLPAALQKAKGWQLVFVGENFALFAKDDQLAGLYVDPHR